MVQTKLTPQQPQKKEKLAAEIFAEKQREISVSEFFLKNRHLLGFDNPRKALLTTVKEAVDNSLDATEDMKVLPEIIVKIDPVKGEEDRFVITVEDNGPGIVRAQIPRIFGKLLYGSKFHKMKQSLTGDEPIIIKQNQKITIVPIGKLISRYLKNEGDVKCEGLEVPCFDWESYKYSFKRASHLIKHGRKNEIYKITTKYGKEIKVTGCHSLFSINKNTLKVEEVQARNLKKADIILAPRRLGIELEKDEVNLLDYIDESHAKKHYWYLYTSKETILEMFSQARLVSCKKGRDRPRPYFRFSNKGRTADVMAESYKQYIGKGFIPVWLVKFLDKKIEEGIIKTYFHGKHYNIPIVWSLTSSLMKFIGLFVAEGHTDKRHIGFTFSKHERDLVDLVCNVGYTLGASYTLDERHETNSVRVNVFGGVLAYIFRKWCGHGAKNKRIPDFIFSASRELRQDCLDYVYKGDGHHAKSANLLTLATTSQVLANQVLYLWLMNGVVASYRRSLSFGLGKKPSMVYNIIVSGYSINRSNHYMAKFHTRRRHCDANLGMLLGLLGRRCTLESLNYLKKLKPLSGKECLRTELGELFQIKKVGYKLRFMLDSGYLVKNENGTFCITEKTQRLCQELEKLQLLLDSDFMFLPVKNIEIINKGHKWVYDISVPGNENFVGGVGGLACHNSRGQQGIGISSAALYGQLTVGKGIRVISKIGPNKPAHSLEIQIDTKNNEPDVLKEEEVQWEKDHGTKITLEIEAKYLKGKQSVDDYLKATAISNPHAHIIYHAPDGQKMEFPRATNQLPIESKEIKPHPYGIELGLLIKMLKDTKARTLQSFLQSDFCRISSQLAKKICEKAGIYEKARPSRIARQEADNLMKAIKSTKIMAPPTNCLAPIGEETIVKGLKKEVDAEFFVAKTRPPSVYRGNPFQVEVGAAFGGTLPVDEFIRIMRFANRVPLLYQQSACAIIKGVATTAWRNYGLSQSKGALPVGPMVLMVHMSSVWVPFTSESKEAIASYPEIIKEIKLALQECGRQLGNHIRKIKKKEYETHRKHLFERYIEEVIGSLDELTKFNREKLRKDMLAIAQKRTVGEEE